MDSQTSLTVKDYIANGVNFPIPESAIDVLCAKREVDPSVEYSAIESDKLRLLHADLLKWIALGVSRVGVVRDADNSWSHSDGGYTLSKEDKKLLIAEANGIYDELEPSSVFSRKRIRMRSAGIMPAYRGSYGEPLRRKPI